MFYGVIQEDYMFEISLKEGIEAVKEWLHGLVETIMKKAKELWEKAKKAKSAAATKLKEIFEKAKAIDKEIKDIKDQNGAKKVKTEIDETEERVKTIEKIVKDTDNKDKSIDDVLDKANTASDNAVNKAKDLINNNP